MLPNDDARALEPLADMSGRPPRAGAAAAAAAARGDGAPPAAAKAEGARVPRPPPEPRFGDFLVGEGCCRAGEEEEELLPLSMLNGDSPAPSALQHIHTGHVPGQTHCSRVRNLHKQRLDGGSVRESAEALAALGLAEGAVLP